MNGPRSGSSFFIAARLLPTAIRRDAVSLYSFCRRVDDLADNAPDSQLARCHLEDVRLALECRDHSQEGDVLDVVERCGVPIHALLQLVDTVESDLGEVRMLNRRALIDYCYGVAGTVGVAMCAVLGVGGATCEEEGLQAAIDLGVAMQLNNIARDVLEDAERGRLYIPLTWVDANVTPQALVDGDTSARQGAYRAIVELVRQAERLFCRADLGMHHIPWASRPAILAAARAYRGLGRRILEVGPDDYWRGKVRLGRRARLAAFGSAMSALLTTRSRSPRAIIRATEPSPSFLPDVPLRFKGR